MVWTGCLSVTRERGHLLVQAVLEEEVVTMPLTSKRAGTRTARSD